MLIDNPDVLRSWLTTTLSPICDADPAALAKYVMALLKKDKTEAELKEFCIDQLDVFLQKETKGFVDQLFIVMKDKSYLNQVTDSTTEVTESVDQVANIVTNSLPENQSRMTTPPPGIPNASDSSNESKKGQIELSESHRSRERQQRSSRRGPQQDHSSPAISGSSQGGPVMRSRVSRSRSRDRTRRQQSPTTTLSLSAVSRERDRVDGKLAVIGVSSDKENRELMRHRRHSPHSRRRRSGSRGEKRTRSRDSSPVGSSSEKERKRKKQRCRDYDEKGYCMKGESCMYDHGPDPVVVEELSLPRIIPGVKPVAPLVDFSQPPPGYVHPPPPGVDHTFAPPISAPNGQAPTAASLTSSGAPEQYNPEAPALSTPSSAVQTNVAPPLPHHAVSTAYGGGQGMCYPLSVPMQPPPTFTVQYTAPPGMQPDLALLRSRELVQLGDGSQPPLSVLGHHPRMHAVVGPVPAPIGLAPHPRMPMYGQGPPHPMAGGPRPMRPLVPHDRTCKTLEVRRVPPYLNTISKLNEHFSQFGQVVNIQICFGGDREAALVSFANRHQAMSAYKSTTPVFNNRFVRMFWHNADPSGQTQPANTNGDYSSSVPERVPVMERLGPVPGSSDTITVSAAAGEEDQPSSVVTNSVSTGNLSKTVYNPAALKAAIPKTLPRQKSVDKEVWKKQVELQKAKMELFGKQLEQQKMLVRQLEKCKESTQKKEIAKMIKLTQANMDKLKDELSKMKVGPPPGLTVKTKAQIERQILDTELEMMNQKQAGSDTIDLHNKLVELKQQLMKLDKMAASAGQETGDGELHPSPSRPRRQSTNGAAGQQQQRKVPHYANLDKRPRELLVSGFDESDKEALIEYMKSFGVVEDLEFLSHSKEGAPLRALVAFKTRREAEMAFTGGKDFNDGSLEIQWYNRRSHLNSEKDEPQAEMSAQDLLATLDDEDDGSSDENQQGEFDEDVPEIERGWKR